jgi:hypothetical protein
LSRSTFFGDSHSPINENPKLQTDRSDGNLLGFSVFSEWMQPGAELCETVRPDTGDLQRIDTGSIQSNGRVENRRAK